MSAVQDALAKVAMFRDLDKKQLARVERIARERTFKGGETIIKEGDEGVGFYLLLSGSVDVTRGGAKLASLRAGDSFGEMALLDNYRRSATVVARDAVSALVLLRSDFMAELRNDAGLAVEMLVMMSRRLREADEALANR